MNEGEEEGGGLGEEAFKACHQDLLSSPEFKLNFGVPLHLFACLEDKEPLKREKTYSKNYEFDQVLCEDEEFKAPK